ncbi:MAG TPA: VOC family protein [Gemmatimonadaceae bacterium]|nr:VOC family protein [Gemmatimonadaceae bacterium]
MSATASPTSASASSPALSLSRIGQISIVVHDVERATAFYRDVLGMRFLFAYPGLAFFDCDGVRIMLSRPEREEFDHPSSVLYFRVTDIQSAYQTLRQRKVDLVDEPHIIARMPEYDLWMCFFHDLDGNTLALMAEATKA